MFLKSSSRLPRIALAVAVGYVLVGCGQGMSGKYSVKNGVQDIAFEFEPGGKVVANIMGNTAEGTYKVDGDQVTIYVNNKNVVMTKSSDGSLTGGPMGMTLTKD